MTWWGSQNKAKNSFYEFNFCLITWLHSLSNVWDEHFPCCCPCLMLFQCFCCILLFLLFFAGKAEICAGPAVVATQHKLVLCTRGGSYQLPPQWSRRNKGRMNSLLSDLGFFLSFGFYLFYTIAAKRGGKVKFGDPVAKILCSDISSFTTFWSQCVSFSCPWSLLPNSFSSCTKVLKMLLCLGKRSLSHCGFEVNLISPALYWF